MFKLLVTLSPHLVKNKTYRYPSGASCDGAKFCSVTTILYKTQIPKSQDVDVTLGVGVKVFVRVGLGVGVGVGVIQLLGSSRVIETP